MLKDYHPPHGVLTLCRSQPTTSPSRFMTMTSCITPPLHRRKASVDLHTLMIYRYEMSVDRHTLITPRHRQRSCSGILFILFGVHSPLVRKLNISLRIITLFQTLSRTWADGRDRKLRRCVQRAHGILSCYLPSGSVALRQLLSSLIQCAEMVYRLICRLGYSQSDYSSGPVSGGGRGTKFTTS